MTFVLGAEACRDVTLQERARLLSALGHPVRLQIVQGLLEDSGCCVSHMVDCLGLPQPLVSRHLSVLREAGVVAVEHEGRHRCYRVVHPCIPALIRCLNLNTKNDAGEKQHEQDGPKR